MASSSSNYLLSMIASSTPEDRGVIVEINTIAVKRGPEINKPNHEGVTPIILASMLGKNEIIKALRANGADIEASDKDGNTAFIHACRNKNESTALLLLNMGANIQHIGGMRRTPLMAAASEGLLNTVTEILTTVRRNFPESEKKAYLSLTDSNGETALQIATRKQGELVRRNATNIIGQKNYNAIIELLRGAMTGGRRQKHTRRHKKRSRKVRRPTRRN